MAKDNNKAGAEAPATLEEALKVIAKLEASVAEKDEVIGELSAQLKDMEGVVNEAKNAGLVNTTITIDKVTYVINHGSILDGTIYTKEELAENADVCKKILAKEGQQTLTVKEA